MIMSRTEFKKPLRDISVLPAAVLLLVAGLLKVHQLSTSPFVENLLFDSRWTNFGMACLELVVAFWLLSRWKTNSSRYVAIVLFCLFLIATSIQLANGKDSCGCFGIVEVPPWVTLLLDIGALVCLLIWSPATQSRFPTPWLFVCSVVLMTSLATMLSFKSAALEKIGQVINEGTMIIVEPNKWTGKAFPLDGLIEGDSAELMHGSWTVILIHGDCPECQELINKSHQTSTKTAFIEVPPKKSKSHTETEFVKWYELSQENNWFVRAPLIVHIVNGVVVNHTSGPPGPS